MEFHSCYPGWGAISAHCNLNLSVSSDSLVSASQVVGITGACHHAWLIFVFSVEMGFYHVGQAGLELLTSDDPYVLASQSAEITSMCHHTGLVLIFLVEMEFLHVGQAGLELLTSGDLPASASQNAGIIGMSHRTQLPVSLFLKLNNIPVYAYTNFCLPIHPLMDTRVVSTFWQF